MDPCVYPGTTVLKNLRGIRNQLDLSKLEADATGLRMRQLESKPLRGKFDSSHLKAIHRYIFQDVYPWAGEFRSVNIARPGQFFFAFSEQIIPCLSGLFERLAGEKLPSDVTGFCDRAAWYMGEINAVDSFRDGNGRSQREFIRELALRQGYVIDWSRTTRAAMGEASHMSFQDADHSGLTAVLLGVVCAG